MGTARQPITWSFFVSGTSLSMAPIFKSGAFLQQCFAIHPRCLSLTRLEEQEHLVLTCDSCNMVHRLTISVVTVRTPAASQAADLPRAREECLPVACLGACVAAHPTALMVREMDVLQDSVGLRCAACRRLYNLSVSAFETRQQ